MSKPVEATNAAPSSQNASATNTRAPTMIPLRRFPADPGSDYPCLWGNRLAPRAPPCVGRAKQRGRERGPREIDGKQPAVGLARPTPQPISLGRVGGCSNAGVIELQRSRRFQDPTRHWITSFPMVAIEPLM